MINKKEVFKITGRQDQDYIIAILHYIQELYNELNPLDVKSKAKVQKRPQWFPFDPSHLIPDWNS